VGRRSSFNAEPQSVNDTAGLFSCFACFTSSILVYITTAIAFNAAYPSTRLIWHLLLKSISVKLAQIINQSNSQLIMKPLVAQLLQGCTLTEPGPNHASQNDHHCI